MSTNAPAGSAGDVADLALADAGKRRIEWAFQSMRVLQSTRKQFIKAQPLAGIRIAACLHVTAEAANLMVTLRDGGAVPVLCASNPLSTQDDVAAALVRDYGIPVYAVNGESSHAYYAHIGAVLDWRPQVLLDEGGDLVTLLHTRRPQLAAEVMGATEETATGAKRIRIMAREGVLQFPVISIDDAQTKHLIDNRYGTGQSTVDGIVRATNILIAGVTFVVAGYGWCGRGIAMRARGMGANVIVTEVDPIRGLEASLDGYRVMSMAEAAQVGDVFCTVTGSKGVIGRDHMERLKNGAILCNAGHFNVEVDVEALARMSSSRKRVRDTVEEFSIRDGRKIYLLGEGRLVNLAAAEGHPASVMDLNFANQALSAEYIVGNHVSLEKRVYPVPRDIDRSIARSKLEAMGIKLDRLTVEQEQYLASWLEGT